MDVYVKDCDRVFDIEMQNKDFKELGLRTRFYQSLVDADCLLRNKKYEDLPESFIIFICKGDPDNPLIKAFLNFVRTNESTDYFSDLLKNTVEKVKENEVFRTRYMSMGIWETDIRNEGRAEGRAQGLVEGRAEGRAEGLAEARKETAINLYKKGITVEIISECTGFSLDELNEFIGSRK